MSDFYFILHNMTKWLKKHFIPHEGNDHQPHFLRNESLRSLILVVFFIELVLLVLPYASFLNPANNFMASVLPAVLDDLTNQSRQTQNLSTLTVNPLLNEVAELKARDMAEKGYFAHISPDGKAPWYWFNLVGYEYEYAGENLAIDFNDSEDVTLAWMNSPAHKENIMKNAYTEIGTGVATGTFEGRSTVFVAQVYGKPATLGAVNDPVVNIVEADTSVSTTEGSSSKVMGASVETDENTAEAVSVTVALEPVLSDPVVNIKPAEIPIKTNTLQKYLASPRHVVNVVLVILGILVSLALILKLFIRMDKRHPILITNGLVALVLVIGVYTVNNYVAMSKTATTTSFASFSNQRGENR